MKLNTRRCLLHLLLIYLSFISSTDETTDVIDPVPANVRIYPIHDVRNCPPQNNGENTSNVRLKVLPGLGFDNLRYLDMGQIHLHNYSTCKITEDGKYILPDSVYVIPLQDGHYKLYAEYFDHWDNYTSITNSKVNAKFGVKFFGQGISGSYSREKQDVKENQVNFKSKTTRLSFRHREYSVHLDPSAELHPSFKSRIYEIGASLQNNDTALARYLAETAIRDYGTHYTKSIEAGGVFVKLDFISETYASNTDKTTITGAASASISLFGSSTFLHFTQNSRTEEIDAYLGNTTRTEVYTIGGELFTPDLTFTDWVNGLITSNRLAIIDRRADPIHFVITPARLPELPIPLVAEIANFIQGAANRYYELNTRIGCLDPKARNFDFQANFGDSSYCDTTFTHIDRAFGGIYQTCHQTGRENLCENRNIAQVNPQTGDYSCPDGYTAVSLYNGTDIHVGAYTEHYRTCTRRGIFRRRSCQDRSRTLIDTTYAYYETFWCVLLHTPEQYRGYIFGGYFTSSSNNPITGTQNCPPYYRIQKIAVDVSICVTNDYELGTAHAVGFAGFHSCRVGNPLSVPTNISSSPEDWPHACPGGYSQHLVSIEDGCEINVCLENGAFQSKSLPPPFLPPFQTKPPFVPYVVEPPAVLGSEGSLLVRNTAGQWETFAPDSEEAIRYIALIQNGTIADLPTDSSVTNSFTSESFVTSSFSTNTTTDSLSSSTGPKNNGSPKFNANSTKDTNPSGEKSPIISVASLSISIVAIVLLGIFAFVLFMRAMYRHNCNNRSGHSEQQMELLNDHPAADGNVGN